MPHGQGEKTFYADKSVLQCTFINGSAIGHGKLTKPGDMGFFYEGSFVNDKPDGEGEETANSGLTYYKG